MKDRIWGGEDLYSLFVENHKNAPKWHSLQYKRTSFDRFNIFEYRKE